MSFSAPRSFPGLCLARAFLVCLAAVCACTARADFAKGADVGWLSEMEASGYKFYDHNGAQKDLLAILQTYSMDSIRLRVWVNPTGGWCGKADVVAQAVRAKSRGMRVMIDFHYSDIWADPGHQAKPAAWANHSFSQLLTDVYDHTFDVLSALKTAGVLPEWVQVGNEIRAGMLWPDGDTAHFSQLAQLINRGYDAVKAVNPTTKVVIHCHNGFETDAFQQFFDQLEANNGKYDVIGLSHYPTTSAWQLRNTQIQITMNTMVSRYGKDVAVCEVGMPVNTPQITKDMLTDLIEKTKAVAGGRGLGVFYWEPEAYNWRNYGLGVWGSNGQPTIGMEAFGNPDQPPPSPLPSITTNPVSQTVAPGGSVTMTVAASGTGLTYQWQNNGVNLSGATSASLTLSNLQGSDGGDYTAIVSNSSGQTTSNPATLTIATPVAGRLTNLSVRTVAASGSGTLIAGFIIGGGSSKTVVVRGTGQTLALPPFNLAGVLSDPLLTLAPLNQPALLTNDAWNAAPNLNAIVATGLTNLGPVAMHPKDSIMMISLASGGYTAQLTDVGGGSGLGLVEVFDTDNTSPGAPGFDAQPRLANLSARAMVNTGAGVLIAGFICNGTSPLHLLIRATGPTLTLPPFNVGGVLADPKLELRRLGDSKLFAQNDDWGSAPNQAEIIAANGHTLAGVPVNTKDSVMVVTIAPGAYTAIVSGMNNTTGVALLEVYELL